MYPIILAILSAMLFGASTPFSKLLLEHLPPFQLAGWLYLGAAAGVAPGLFVRRKGNGGQGTLSNTQLFRLIGAIGCGGVAGPVLLLLGLQRASAASVAMWMNLELVATAILGYLVFKDHLGRGGWIGVAGTIVASVLLSWQGGGVGLLALLLVSSACICWGLDNHLTALIDGITAEQSTFWKGLVAGGVNLSLGLMIEPQAVGVGPALTAMAVGVFAYGFSIVLYIRSAQQLGATRSQMIFSSAPFFGVVLSVIFLEDRIALVEGVAGLILILSLVIIFRDQHIHSHIHKATVHQHAHRHGDPHHGHDHPDTNAKTSHDHTHSHRPLAHSHPHWPDLHHRHKH